MTWREYRSRNTATAYQVEDTTESVVTSTGRTTAARGDYVVNVHIGDSTYTTVLTPEDFHREWVRLGLRSDAPAKDDTVDTEFGELDAPKDEEKETEKDSETVEDTQPTEDHEPENVTPVTENGSESVSTVTNSGRPSLSS